MTTKKTTTKTNSKSIKNTYKNPTRKSKWFFVGLPQQYGRRKHAVVAEKANGERILISYKNAEKQGLKILRFAVKEEISFIR